MSEFNLKDLEKIYKQEEIMDFLVEHDVIKEKKFIKEYKYEKELKALQYDLVHLQAYLAHTGKRIVILFEGRDAAGKGGSIKRIVKNLNPKRYHIVALPKPTEKEQGQWYFQRYLKELPTAGYFAFYDRSWYNRAVVEPVFDFCTEDEHELFMKEVNHVEQRLVNDGIVFIKFFLDISKEEQKERLDKRKEDPLKKWKLGDLDKQALEKWDSYTHYIKKMLDVTATPELPWIEIRTDDKKTARLEIIKYLLNNVEGFKPQNEIELDDDVVIKHT
ncbi:polyphosphate kinase 2 [Flavobacteriaceae bacterium Ap0902]|nr:polyphosphate kinase 2 [Flavobacteriaceae bacterium Ap0902]